MARARKELVCVADTPYYHVVSRCVRRAYLCGFDTLTQRSYEHRRQWVEDRIRILSSVFSVGICAYAIMSNHYHIVLKLMPDEADTWSDRAVLKQWLTLHKGPLLARRYVQHEPLSPAEQATVADLCRVYRKRLQSLSWFMKCLNEPIARRANQEDCCTGHFWEARFKSQALRDETALLTGMTYVDLNPVRASIAQTPERSDHTSIKERIEPSFDLVRAIQQQVNEGWLKRKDIDLRPLLPFSPTINAETDAGIAFSFADYLQLVDWTGRAVRLDKRGAISPILTGILDRIQLSPEVWLANSTQFEARYRHRFGGQRANG